MGFPLFVFLFLAFLSSWSQGQPKSLETPQIKIQGFSASADDSLWDHERETVTLEGNVQLVKNQQHISCDKAVIYLRLKKLELYGHVEVVSATQSLIGEEVLLDYETGTGLIRNGFVKSGNVAFEGALLQKIGEDEFYVADSTYTSCTNCPATWSFSGKSIRAELGGYAYIKNSVMRIGGVPVLWLPYLVVPLKSDRQSGLLTPTIGSSEEGGTEFAQGYFWAIDRSSDLTYTMKYFAKRSFMHMFNYRYVLSENSGGELDAGWIRDRVFNKSSGQFKEFRTNPNDFEDFNRWYIHYQHKVELQEGWTQRMLIHNASDLRYPLDFEKETLERNLNDPALENRINFSKNTHDIHTSIDSSYYINLLRADPLSNNEDAVHRLPEVTVSQSSQKWGDWPFRYSWDLRYTHFARTLQPYDDLSTGSVNGTEVKYPSNSQGPLCENDPNCEYEFDGVYNSGNDLIRAGQRLDFKPELVGNFRYFQALDITPKLTYRETRYYFPVGDDIETYRRYLKTEISSKLTFSQIYGDSNPQAIRYKHLIEPEISYSNIPWLDSEDHPFFSRQSTVTPSVGAGSIVSDGDLVGGLGIQFDENDRILDRNLITLGLTNRLIQRLWGGDIPQYRQVVRFKLSQSYNLSREARADGASPWSDLSGVLTVRFDSIETNTSFNYFPEQRVTNVKTRTAFINDKGQFYEVGLERTYTIVQGQEFDSKQRLEDISFGLGFSSSPVNFVGQFVYDANRKNTKSDSYIKSWGYLAQLKPPGECWQINFTQDQKVGGDVRTLVGFEFSFDGVPKPAPARSTLDQFRN